MWIGDALTCCISRQGFVLSMPHHANQANQVQVCDPQQWIYYQWLLYCWSKYVHGYCRIAIIGCAKTIIFPELAYRHWYSHRIRTRNAPTVSYVMTSWQHHSCVTVAVSLHAASYTLRFSRCYVQFLSLEELFLYSGSGTFCLDSGSIILSFSVAPSDTVVSEGVLHRAQSGTTVLPPLPHWCCHLQTIPFGGKWLGIARGNTALFAHDNEVQRNSCANHTKPQTATTNIIFTDTRQKQSSSGCW